MKNCEQCGKEFEANREGKKYCSNTCRSKASILRNAGINQQSLGQAEIFPEKKKETKPEYTPAAPTGLNPQAQYIITDLTRQRDKAEKLLEQREGTIKEKDKTIETLRAELAEIKTDQKIKSIEVEHKKPSGLDGILESPLGPYIGQALGKLAEKLVDSVSITGAPQLAGGEAGNTTEAATQLHNWFMAQPGEVQEIFYALINDLEGQGPEEKLIRLKYMKNLINYGTTATGTHG